MSSSRPDKPLVVKCTFDRYNKRITFSSARNCTYELLRHKVEQCFSLSATSYVIAYKDDDGEVTDITTETDLTEAIHYFQAGSDEPVSSAASILSGRSFGSRKIVLRVHISVDYDGPSLSDTSSLASIEEYKGRSGSKFPFLMRSANGDLDDDAVTVSSRDTGVRSRSSATSSRLAPPRMSSPNGSGISSWERISRSSSPLRPSNNGLTSSGGTAREADPFADENGRKAAADDAQDDSGAIFERLKLEDTRSDTFSTASSDRLASSDRGAAWLRDQNERAIRARVGALPEPSEDDDQSLLLSNDDDLVLGGDLALERNPSGKYYYSYTAGSSGASQSHNDDARYSFAESSVDGMKWSKPRPTSRQLNWLASQYVDVREPPIVKVEATIPEDEIPPELLQYLPVTTPPPEDLTACSECGVLLDALRYICSTCGELTPLSKIPDKGKGRDLYPEDAHNHTYPPRGSSLSTPSPNSSQTYLGGSFESLVPKGRGPYKPLNSSSNLISQSTLYVPGIDKDVPGGYELCAGCIESAGVNHAVETSLEETGSSPASSPSSPEGSLEWRRKAPKRKGNLRHAFHEKIWGHHGWGDVEQDESDLVQCSACQVSTPPRKCFRCASCQKYYLCRACYSQVHDLHPSHAFLVVPSVKTRSTNGSHGSSDTDPTLRNLDDAGEEQSMKHPGVKCFHCLLDIVGARFHCAICDSVDICSNCESAGLPGNLDSQDGGHTSSHILIKIPYPLETDEVQIASRRAMNLWHGRDAASVGFDYPQDSKAGSVYSSYAETIVGKGALSDQAEDHHVLCSSCARPIIGVRYQCGTCPSIPRPYSLCTDCEVRSYIVHDPMHVFFKLPRPVQRPIESTYAIIPRVYKSPVGHPQNQPPPLDPKAYLQRLTHSSAICDRCVALIQGPWFRCAYCGQDLCEPCESVDTHNDSHCFIVFKSAVDMQALKNFASLDNSRPVLKHPIYFH